MSKKVVGLKELAAELDISMNTVSRALRDCDDVNQKTKEKVRKKAIELGYLPNTVSQFVGNGKKTIAIILNNITNLFFNYICSNLFSIIEGDENYDVCIIHTKEKNLDKAAMKNCISQRIDGIISLIGIDDEAIEIAKMNNIPVVLLGLRNDNDYIYKVHTNDEMGGQIVANYLANYHKIKKMLYISIGDTNVSNTRYNSFKEEIEKISKETNTNIKVDQITYSSNIGQKILEYVRKGYRGIFCFCDSTAYYSINQLNKLIPNFRAVYPSVHICGYDCLSTKIYGLVDITSIDFDYKELSIHSFETLKNCFAKKETNKTKIVDVTLHQRKNK